ncbi:hypothetical protein NIES4071_20880 [Calothrix sp. NIES-4071]|nr:hypothetical protein NIES4071_20880 [Calothrix sp. NIES-4071]BAZ56420.1 hypothetical protein NIES4105_20830 [Calothrix sp. NIES-4105]
MQRQELGEFFNIYCLKAAISGMEEALGEKATAPNNFYYLRWVTQSRNPTYNFS